MYDRGYIMLNNKKLFCKIKGRITMKDRITFKESNNDTDINPNCLITDVNKSKSSMQDLISGILMTQSNMTIQVAESEILDVMKIIDYIDDKVSFISCYCFAYSDKRLRQAIMKLSSYPSSAIVFKK